MDPCGIRLVNARRAGQSPLGQGADRNQTANHGVRVLMTPGHGTRKRLVTRRGRLHGVVVVPGQHTSLERADDLGALADSTHVLGGHGAHAGRSRLARVPVGRAVLATHGDRLALPVLNVPGPNNSTHWYYSLRKFLGPSLEKHLEFHFV